MICLDFILDEINPLGLLHLNVEGWEAYALHGALEELHIVDNACFVVYEVWYERDSKRRYLALRDADGFGPPCDDVLSAMAEYPKSERINNIVDQDRNLCFRFRGEEDLVGGRW